MCYVSGRVVRRRLSAQLRLQLVIVLFRVQVIVGVQVDIGELHYSPYGKYNQFGSHVLVSNVLALCYVVSAMLALC